jgi:hypothetical protein
MCNRKAVKIRSETVKTYDFVMNMLDTQEVTGSSPVAASANCAVKMRWDGHILGAAGPLSPDALEDPDDYTYTDQLNDSLQERRDKLILMEPCTC